MQQTVIRSNTDGIDSALEILATVDRNLSNDEKNEGLPEPTRAAAAASRASIQKARSQLVEARESAEKMRIPKERRSVAERGPERTRVAR